MTSFLNKLIAKQTGTEPEEEKEPNLPWDSFRWKIPSPRVARRARIQTVLRANKSRMKVSRRRARILGQVAEAEAVRRLREWERENGSGLQHLLATGVYRSEDVLDSKGIPLIDIADRLGLLEEVDA